MERLTAQDYLDEALAVLGESGSEALTIAALCERLGVTKGSFYHHFAGMSAFVTTFLEHWERTHSEQSLTGSKQQPDPALRGAAFTELAVNLPHASEAALRAWGRSNPEVATVAGRVDKRRERYLLDCYLGLGADRARARLLARTAVNALIGAQQRETRVDRRWLREMFDQLAEQASA